MKHLGIPSNWSLKHSFETLVHFWFITRFISIQKCDSALGKCRPQGVSKKPLTHSYESPPLVEKPELCFIALLTFEMH